MKALFSSLEFLEPRIAPASLTVTNLNDSGAGSLRAILAGSHNGDVITFKAGLAGLIHVNSTLTIADSVTINGGGQITLDGGGKVQLLSITDGKSTVIEKVSLSGLTLRNGLASGAAASGGPASVGGAIYDTESLTISNCNFKTNLANYRGGAIYAEAGQLAISGSTFSNNGINPGGNGGGAVFAIEQTLTVTNTSFSGNYSQSGGTAMEAYVTAGSFSMSGSSFTHNSTADRGGSALSLEMIEGGTATVSTSTFTANGGALAVGGGLQIFSPDNSVINLNSDTISNNTAYTGGGADFYSLGAITLTNCKILNNSTFPSDGGGLLLGGTLITLKNTTVSGNSASPAGYGQGGGIFLASGKLVLDHSTITGNQASNSGGVANHGTIQNIASIISGNTPA
ncbi:MAG: hypothetical protein QM796_21775 [Chthoniobacteraceae bacterium]